MTGDERGNFPPWTGKVAPLATEKTGAGRAGNWQRLPRPTLRTLTPEQVARLRAPGAKTRALAKKFKISHVAAWKIVTRKTYRDLP